MNVLKKSSTGVYLMIGIIITTFLYFLPLFIKGFSINAFLAPLLNNVEGFSGSLFRSLIFAIISSLFNITVGFFIALLLKHISIISLSGRQLSWFLLPVILGNASVAFIFKVSLFNTHFFNNIIQAGSYSHFSLLLLLQFWQFGFLFAYLFWSNFHSINESKLGFAKAFKLNSWEILKDITLPLSKNLGVLLFLIGFVFAFYESAKSQFVFKASQGTNTELISHWLERTYHSKLLVNLDYATSYVFKSSLLVFISSLLTFLIIGMILNFLLQKISRTKGTDTRRFTICNNIYIKRFSKIIFLLTCFFIILLPVTIVFCEIGVKFSNQISKLTLPLGLTLVSATLTTLFSLTFAIIARLVFKNTLQNFNSSSMILFALLFMLLLFPSIAILLSGFQWLSWLGYNSNIMIYFVWVSGHAVLLSPLLIGFLILIHFQIKVVEIEYISAYRLQLREIFINSFIKRFKAEYIFTLIIACSFIWNEAVLNIILSDRIPSFAANLQMMFVGRAANYQLAASYLIVSILLAVISIILWQKILKKAAVAID